MILLATEKDVPQVVNIHKNALQDTIFGRMTDAQLSEFYKKKSDINIQYCLYKKIIRQ